MSEENDWKTALPEQLRDAPFLGKAESLEDAAHKLQHAANHVGNSLRLPSQEASESEVREFETKVLERFSGLMHKPTDDNYGDVLAQLGTPEDADGYELADVSAEEIADLREQALAAGLTKKQFEKLYGPQLQAASEAQTQALEAHKEEIRDLKALWGEAFNDKIAAIREHVKETGAPQAIIDAVVNDQAGADVLQWIDKWSKVTSETAQNRSRDSTPTSRLTPDEAESRWHKLQENPAYWDNTHHEYARVHRQADELAAIAWPGTA